ncbi:MAG: hypothetical protein WDN24_05440 [Sphingomonas sp.]
MSLASCIAWKPATTSALLHGEARGVGQRIEMAVAREDGFADRLHVVREGGERRLVQKPETVTRISGGSGWNSIE